MKRLTKNDMSMEKFDKVGKKYGKMKYQMIYLNHACNDIINS